MSYESKLHPSLDASEYNLGLNKSGSLPFNLELIEAISKKYPTPFYIYDERGIKSNALALNQSFCWNTGFREYFAVKALPNPNILSILKAVGFGVDCSSLAELILADRAGFSGEEIMFTSNNTPRDEFIIAAKMGAIINLDDLEHFSYLEETLERSSIQFPQIISFRFNPGKEREGNFIIGNPEEAKFGCTREQLFTAYSIAKNKGVERFGLHAMIASNELNTNYFVKTVASLLDLKEEISHKLGINFDFLNMGGGIGIPYKPNETAVNIQNLSEAIKMTLENNESEIRNLSSSHCSQPNKTTTKLYMECGRLITGPYGYLATRIIHKKNTYKRYLGVDASMANLMRPGMYGAYHHITILGKEANIPSLMYDVTGSLCENNDKFAINRLLPEAEVGDIIVIHDVGAHGHAMGFNYNGKLRSAEILLKENGSVMCIRRAETLDDYFATII